LSPAEPDLSVQISFDTFLQHHPDCLLVNLDVLTYASNLESLQDVSNSPSYRFLRGDVCDHDLVVDSLKEYSIDTVVHFAAESHVDRSIMGSSVFVRTNVVGTHTVLEAAREQGIERFVSYLYR
jgi:dTDP-glucose 4,6-dehydratase